jgi:hypothetical protein
MTSPTKEKLNIKLRGGPSAKIKEEIQMGPTVKIKEEN